MDYKNKYNEALERARELSKTITGANYEYIFPELKESEDERIRELCKVLVRTCFMNELCTKEDNDECMAWIEKQGKNNTGISETTRQKLEDNLNKALEKETPESWNEFLDKQGEQKLVEWSEEDEEIMSTIMEEGDLKHSERNWLKSLKDRIQSKTRKKNIEQNLAKKYGITGIGSKHAEGKLGEMIKKKIETEKQDKQKFGQLEECLDCQFNYAGTCEGSCPLTRCERKPTDNTNKIEPKFKDGDWIVYKDGVWKVCNISLQDCYELLKTNNEVNTRLIKDVDKEAHLWTINDAKPGDIIYAESKFNTFDFIAIFSEIKNKNSWEYCSVDSDSDDYSDDLDHWEFDDHKGFVALDRYNFYPATKKQRHLLYQKMKDAGYEWDAEKKELKDF